MKNLLFVINQLYRGGAETSLVNLINKLDYNEYHVDLLILDQHPVKSAVSLIKSIHSNVCVCDAYKKYQHLTLMNRMKAKLVYTSKQKIAFYLPALNFVRNKFYDWAFFVGEWHSPAFVATQVNASKKAAWIHNDLSKAEYFNAEEYFYFYECFDKYIFVSNNSMNESINRYPFLKEKSTTIYNINDVKNIKKKATEKVDDFLHDDTLPLLVTCANFRLQKNHKKQVEVMVELKKRGINFIWINLGSLTDSSIVSQINALIKKHGLEKQFIIMGPKSNPYKYMNLADAVTVLSSYESWSMVITEAKILGIPVISTKTSGALEQLEHGKTGLLTDFTVNDIADKIELFFKDNKLQEKIKQQIRSFDTTDEILKSFKQFLSEQKTIKPNKLEEKILYVIDDINYMGGAHIATKLQIKEFLNQNRNITIFSSNTPSVNLRKELNGVSFITWKDFHEDDLYNRTLCDCLFDKKLSITDKRRKLFYSYKRKFKNDNTTFENNVMPHLSKLFSKYDIICVISEGSVFRNAVANSTCKKKIQWIHIDYADWKNKSYYNRTLTKNDGSLYKKFNTIVVLTESIKNDFIKLYPHLNHKVVINKNILPTTEILKKSVEPHNIMGEGQLKFITVGRVDHQKAYERLIPIFERLYVNGYCFFWTIIGDGNEYSKIAEQISYSPIKQVVELKGALENPFPFIKRSDVFALLSDFEGLPNTIYESLILGVPVVATNVGGVSEQVITGETGWLCENNEESIYAQLEYILNHQDEVTTIKCKLENYHYDNKNIIDINNQLFFR